LCSMAEVRGGCLLCWYWCWPSLFFNLFFIMVGCSNPKLNVPYSFSKLQMFSCIFNKMKNKTYHSQNNSCIFNKMKNKTYHSQNNSKIKYQNRRKSQINTPNTQIHDLS
jgi:hypothetical protein